MASKLSFNIALKSLVISTSKKLKGLAVQTKQQHRATHTVAEILVGWGSEIFILSAEVRKYMSYSDKTVIISKQRNVLRPKHTGRDSVRIFSSFKSK